jgi:elongation factor G
VVLERIRFPEPVISIAISPRSKADADKLGMALRRLTDEDPTLRIDQDAQTGETVFSGMGELHLEVIVERLRREFKVETNVAAPQVAYYETVTRPVQRGVKFKRQSGGRGQYAHVVLELEPLQRGSGFEFEEKLRGEAIPRKYVPAVEAGIKDAMEQGVLAKRPVVDVKVTLLDGSYHEVDSSDRAFRTAAAIAFKEGMAQAGPIILEPVMRMEVVAPDDFTGDVIGDLTSRGGSILNIERRNGSGQSVDAHVRLANLFGYATVLRSQTQGRGNFSMEFDHYAPVGEDTAEELIAEQKQPA